MRGTLISRLRSGAARLFRDHGGNAMMLTAAAIVPVLGIVGSAVDIGRAYMTQLRLQQACDAGVLAGRRAMAAGTYSDKAKGEANKMFNFNFPDGIYSTTDVSFTSAYSGKSDVAGNAAAKLPTALMYIFGKDAFDLSVNCTAKLEISNVDVMLVLDVTGSMAGARIAALQTAAKDFFDTLTSADIGDGQLRFGVVPYSSSVNVGQILRDANPDWLSTTVTLPSRTYNNTSREEERCTGSGSKKKCSNVTLYEYTYGNREFSVGSPKPGDSLTFNTGAGGADMTGSWNGCIIERQTTDFAANATAPSNAFDMDIDMVPTANDATKWKLFLPAFTYDREQTAERTLSYAASDTDRMNKNFVEIGGTYAACPVPAMKLTKMSKSDKASFDAYIDGLQAKGYTYHDSGMAWGARLISPTGLFASENVLPDKPISRHLVFMTDGQMETPMANLSHQGQERSMPRVGASSDSNAASRHNNRFVQLCRRSRAQGITIWVVSFGVGSNTNLNNCASSGEAYQSSDADELNANFQAIARQISKLRLAQ